MTTEGHQVIRGCIRKRPDKQKTLGTHIWRWHIAGPVFSIVRRHRLLFLQILLQGWQRHINPRIAPSSTQSAGSNVWTSPYSTAPSPTSAPSTSSSIRSLGGGLGEVILLFLPRGVWGLLSPHLILSMGLKPFSAHPPSLPAPEHLTPARGLHQPLWRHHQHHSLNPITCDMCPWTRGEGGVGVQLQQSRPRPPFIILSVPSFTHPHRVHPKCLHHQYTKYNIHVIILSLSLTTN